MGLLKKIFGDYSQKEVKRIRPLCNKVLDLEEEYSKLTDEQLQAKTPEFKERLANGETLDDILPEAFAACREASWRVIGLKHFPVQIIGGIILHQGRIAEMKTGEGKTLVATLPAYLNGLSGEGVHIVTVNDYLARRDSEWMGKIYTFLGLTVGLIVHDLEKEERQKAYNADITYGTNNELGFDYLRDNLVIYKKDMVQRPHSFAIVDEVDSILIDEARTPLIISGQGEKSTKLYEVANAIARGLKCHKIKESDDKKIDEELESQYDYIVDEKARSATLTASGIEKVERAFDIENFSDPENSDIVHHINQAIRAWGTMRRDVEYVVKDGQVIIVDSFTGRLMPGRRYSDGLHQAIEAKEGVKVERESKTLATITFQNYFRLYKKLSGMTGTALTEEDEFREIYNLDVIVIPTNKPMIREDLSDKVFATEKGKYTAIIKEIKACHEKGQPVLVGTVSIDKSEALSHELKKNGIPHNVLNAKLHEKEAEIVAQAGKYGAVTISTNMAGRGTDIMLGGNPEFMARADLRREGFADELIAMADSIFDTDNEEILGVRERFNELVAKHEAEIAPERAKVVEAGGLYIIGTERHESRRIDNQLRGRAGRQGDPGKSCFHISFEDDLMRLFAGDKLKAIMTSINGIAEDEAIDHPLLSSVIENAQKKLEGQNFARRKNVLMYDDVMNEQRKVIYQQRREVLDGADLEGKIRSMAKSTVAEKLGLYLPPEKEGWDIEGLIGEFYPMLINDEEKARLLTSELDSDEILKLLTDNAERLYDEKEAMFTEEQMREAERVILLRNVDRMWMDHIDAMDELEEGIRLQSYGQRDPVVAYKIEGSQMFDEMISEIRASTVRQVLSIMPKTEIKRENVVKITGASHGGDTTAQKKAPVRKTEADKVGRNDPCPCGSGLKYKKCCGKNLGGNE